MMTEQESVLLRCSRFHVSKLSVAGRDGREIVREVVRHPGAVVLLPLLDSDRAVMIENRRHAVGETLLELPAGTLESDEPPEETAARELIEETGYRPSRLELIHEFYSCPGICDELMRLYAATGLVEGEPDREATEEIENRIVSRDEVPALMSEGKIRDAKTLVGLYAWLRMPSE